MTFVVLAEEGDPHPSEVWRGSVEVPDEELGTFKGMGHYKAELEVCKRMRARYSDIDSRFPKASFRVEFPRGFFPRA